MCSALTPRKTAQQARAKVTLGAIIEAAARILETQGLDGLTTNHIAATAGVSIGSLYQYFPNKQRFPTVVLTSGRMDHICRTKARGKRI